MLLEQKKPCNCGSKLHSLPKQGPEAAAIPASSLKTPVDLAHHRTGERRTGQGDSITPASTRVRVESEGQPPAYVKQ
jgi:hypothetical protein